MQWHERRNAVLVEFMDHSREPLPEEWIDASVLSYSNLTLTSEQLAEITKACARFIDENVTKYRGLKLPGSRPVQLRFNAFPLISGKETPL